jgi:hypothetical protein
MLSRRQEIAVQTRMPWRQNGGMKNRMKNRQRHNAIYLACPVKQRRYL